MSIPTGTTKQSSNDTTRLEGVYSRGYSVVSKHVMTDHSITPEARLIYALYCVLSNNNGGWQDAPSEADLRKYLGMSHTPFCHHRKMLCDKGYLLIRQNVGQCFSHGQFLIAQDVTDPECYDPSLVITQQGIFHDGYGIVPRMVLLNESLSKNAKALYTLLCVYAPASLKQDAVAFHPELSASYLSREYMDKVRLARARKELEIAGYLQVVEQRPKPLRYILLLHLKPMVEDNKDSASSTKGIRKDKPSADSVSVMNVKEQPAVFDTTQPAVFDTTQPAVFDTTQPAVFDTTQPAVFDTTQPAVFDTAQPAVFDTTQPAVFDTTQPAVFDTTQPAVFDTAQPAVFKSAEIESAEIKTAYINTLDRNTGERNTLSNTSVSLSSRERIYGQEDGLDKESDIVVDDTIWEDACAEQIEADILASEFPPETVKAVINIMAEVYALPHTQTIKINGVSKTASAVQKRFRELNFYIVESMLTHLNDACDVNTDIKNKHAYFRTMMFNAPTDFGISNAVNPYTLL